MSQAIPSHPTRPAHADSPELQTPNGSPPSASPAVAASFENRLNELLAHFDSGTHEFCRRERETPEEKALGWGGEERKPLLKKGSLNFLSSLSLSRPSFSATPTPAPSQAAPVMAPTYGGFPKGFAGLPMVTGTSPPLGIHRASTGGIPHWPTRAPSMERASSSPTTVATTILPSAETSMPPPPPAAAETKRRFSTNHFDPSREPKLLGLL